MHQPDYRDHIRNEFQLSWVYLHAIKDYSDMVAHVEAVPGAKCVFNFSPILLEQLEVYEQQLAGHLNDAQPLNDPLLAALATPVFPVDTGSRLALIKTCLRSNRKRIIDRFPPYQRLARIAEPILHDPVCEIYVSDQYLADLVTWYHLAWMGETVRRSDHRLRHLIDQGAGFSLHQRHGLLHVVAEQLALLRQRYRRLAEQGRIELSMSPYAHPMIPLLLQFGAARDTQPEAALPGRECYPSGRERAIWHVQEGLKVFQRYFGITPGGCWPSEGGISAATLDLLSESGFRWAATGEAVLRNSFRRTQMHDNPAPALYSAYRRPGSSLRLFARNDELSDLIGFRYADWHANDAVSDLIHRLESIANQHAETEDAVVSIIMDGENAWEHYPENGYYFLSSLYERLAHHPRIRLSTFGEVLDKVPVRELESIAAGSWVYGTFSTWIGEKDKNQAWDILCEAKDHYDRIRGTGTPEQQLRIDRQLAVCEASDWFWWFGDGNPSETVREFERLYRLHLTNLYQMMGLEPPESLSHSLAHGGGSPERGGVMRPSTPGHPH